MSGPDPRATPTRWVQPVSGWSTLDALAIANPGHRELASSRHALAVSELYVALREMECAPDVALVGFDTEPPAGDPSAGPAVANQI